jgi:hypothetical protein
VKAYTAWYDKNTIVHDTTQNSKNGRIVNLLPDMKKKYQAILCHFILNVFDRFGEGAILMPSELSFYSRSYDFDGCRIVSK